MKETKKMSKLTPIGLAVTAILTACHPGAEQETDRYSQDESSDGTQYCDPPGPGGTPPPGKTQIFSQTWSHPEIQLDEHLTAPVLTLRPHNPGSLYALRYLSDGITLENTGIAFSPTSEREYEFWIHGIQSHRFELFGNDGTPICSVNLVGPAANPQGAPPDDPEVRSPVILDCNNHGSCSINNPSGRCIITVRVDYVDGNPIQDPYYTFRTSVAVTLIPGVDYQPVVHFTGAPETEWIHNQFHYSYCYQEVDGDLSTL